MHFTSTASMRLLQALCCIMLVPVRAEVHDPENWQPLLAGDFYHHGGSSPIKPSYGEGGYGLLGGSEGYHPEVPHSEEANDQCSLYKVTFTQDLYFQYIQYKTSLPDLKEFTLCYWAKFANHSNDHPIYSYAVDGQPKAILAWISNTKRSSYFSLSIEGHTFYRLNYPLRLNRWYHTCQSWNGKTGEWQVWVNAERVGRGFYNRLVGHVIPSGGVAITGQEQSQLGGGFQEGHEAPQGSGGMLGEVTMLQLYRVALTAGKAHKDHKHHHAHQYDHNGNMITTPAPTTTPRNPLPSHPLLTGGQLNKQSRINFANGQQPQVIQGQQYNVGYANGQLVGGVVTQQLTKGAQQSGLGFAVPPQPQPQSQPQPQQVPAFGTFSTQSIQLRNPANVQFIDNTFSNHPLFKRQNDDDLGETPEFGKRIEKRETEQNKQKRELFVAGGTLFDDGFLSGPAQTALGGGGYGYQQSLQFGLAGIGNNQPIIKQQKQDDEREPAEAEVKAVMTVCSGCEEEPFDKALVFGWRTVPKKLYSGAYYGPAVAQCRVF